MKFCVIMPALNEEGNIESAVQNTLKAFSDFSIDGQVLVVNDGSTDGTRAKVEEMMARDPRVSLINHETPQGIGASFWEGTDVARADAVVMLPGDNENDPWEIFQYSRLLEHVDIVIPFLYNTEARSLFRRALSFLYRSIVNTTFFVNFNYTNGTVLYRKSVLEGVKYRSRGFFYQTDILIRTVKSGYLFAEVPYRVNARKGGISKAVSFPSLLQVIRGYGRLFYDIHLTGGGRKATEYALDSRTAERSKDAYQASQS